MNHQIVFIIFQLAIVVSQRVPPPQYSTPIPGIYARFGSSIFSYISRIAATSFDDAFRQMRIAPQSQCFTQGCINLYDIQLSEYRPPMSVSVVSAPPNRLVLQIDSFDISIAGSLGGELLVILPILLNGMLYVTASQISLVVNIDLQRDSGRKLFANIQSCQPQLSYISATVVDGGTIGDSINNQQMIDRVRQMLGNQLCAKTRELIDTQVNSRLATIPLVYPISKVIQIFGESIILNDKLTKVVNEPFVVRRRKLRMVPASVIDYYDSIIDNDSPRELSRNSNITMNIVTTPASIRYVTTTTLAPIRYAQLSKPVAGISRPQPTDLNVVNRQKHNIGMSSTGQSNSILQIDNFININALNQLWLDVGITETFADYEYYGVGMRGSVFIANDPLSIPYSNQVINFPRKYRTKRMVELIIGDYVANMFFYNAQRIGALNLRFNRQSNFIGKFLRTTCANDDRCLGDSLPDIKLQYPNSNFEVEFIMIRAPKVVFSEKSGGYAYFQIDGELKLSIDDSEQKHHLTTMGVIADASINGQMQQNNRITGNILISSLKLTDKLSQPSNSEFSQATLDTLNDEIRTVIENELKQFLNTGIVIRSSLSLPVHNVMFRIAHHCIYVETDIAI